jgi:hypothetical protein
MGGWGWKIAKSYKNKDFFFAGEIDVLITRVRADWDI